MCVRIIVHNCCIQHSTEQFWYFPSPDNHHTSDDVYWRGGWCGTSTQDQLRDYHLPCNKQRM